MSPFEKASEIIRKIETFSRKQKWEEVETDGDRLVDIAKKHPNIHQIQLAVLWTAAATVYRYGLVKKWEKLEKWGKRAMSHAENIPDKGSIPEYRAQVALNAISVYAEARKWTGLEEWRERLTKYAEKFPDNGEVQSYLASAAVIAISACAEARKWTKLKEWEGHLKTHAENFPENAGIRRKMARAAIILISIYSESKQWEKLEEWNKHLADIKHSDDILLLEDFKKFSELLKFKSDDLALRVLWFLQIRMLDLLKVDFFAPEFHDLKIAHYSPFEPLIYDSSKKLWLCHAAGTNDTSEGKILQRFLGLQPSGREKMLAMQASFSRAIDNLNQFRLYSGKDGANPGTGFCLVFNQYFFADSDSPHSLASKARKDNEAFRIAMENEQLFGSEKPPRNLSSDEPDTSLKRKLYWVLYFDWRCEEGDEPFFIHTPTQLMTALKIYPSGRGISPIGGSKVAENMSERIRMTLLALKNGYKHYCKTDEEKKIAWHLLIYLRHLFKDAAFAEEREMRILTLCELGRAEEDDKTKKLYLNYLPPISEEDTYLEKVIVGPCYTEAEFDQLKYRWINTLLKTNITEENLPNFSKSKAPLAKPAAQNINHTSP